MIHKEYAASERIAAERAALDAASRDYDRDSWIVALACLAIVAVYCAWGYSVGWRG